MIKDSIYFRILPALFRIRFCAALLADSNLTENITKKMQMACIKAASLCETAIIILRKE